MTETAGASQTAIQPRAHDLFTGRGHRLSRSGAQIARTEAAREQAASLRDLADLGAGDFLDILNPLHHVPLVGTAYRHLTGDEIAAPAKLAGAAIYGGPVGFAAQAGQEVIAQAEGQRPEATILAALTGQKPDKAVARAERGTPAPPNDQLAQSAPAPAAGPTAPSAPSAESGPRPAPSPGSAAERSAESMAKSRGGADSEPAPAPALTGRAALRAFVRDSQDRTSSAGAASDPGGAAPEGAGSEGAVSDPALAANPAALRARMTRALALYRQREGS